MKYDMKDSASSIHVSFAFLAKYTHERINSIDGARAQQPLSPQLSIPYF